MKQKPRFQNGSADDFGIMESLPEIMRGVQGCKSFERSGDSTICKSSLGFDRRMKLFPFNILLQENVYTLFDTLDGFPYNILYMLKRKFSFQI